MPPRAAAKRKAAPESDSDASAGSGSQADETQKKTKKPAAKKAAKGPVTPLDPALPHNAAFPVDLKPFAAKAEGATRYAG